MTPLEKLLRAEARRLGIGVEVLLNDYAIGHVLGAIAAEPTLSDTLVFKGGTAQDARRARRCDTRNVGAVARYARSVLLRHFSRINRNRDRNWPPGSNFRFRPTPKSLYARGGQVGLPGRWPPQVPPRER